eukprot:gene9449-9615_t
MALATKTTRSAFGCRAAPVRGARVVVRAGKRNDVSDSYAKALVELAEEKNVLEPVHADVDAVASLIKENKKLSELMFNPVVEADKKKAVVAKISKEAGFQKYTTNFLNLLVEKDRVNLLSEICESFEEQYCQLTDTQVATLRSAVKLEQEQQFLIAKKLQELTGSKNIKLKPVIDQSLIAGFVVEYGSSQIDLSIRGQIEKVAEELSKAAYLAVTLLLARYLDDYDTSASLLSESCHESWPEVVAKHQQQFPLVVWDSVFLHRISVCGYEYEQYFAFFPGLPGTYGGAAVRPWCHKALPSAYGYVQDVYWDLGLFKFYRLDQEVDGLLWVFPDSSPGAAAAAAAASPAVIDELSQPEEWEPRTDWFLREIPVSMETVVENVLCMGPLTAPTPAGFKMEQESGNEERKFKATFEFQAPCFLK